MATALVLSDSDLPKPSLRSVASERDFLLRFVLFFLPSHSYSVLAITLIIKKREPQQEGRRVSILASVPQWKKYLLGRVGRVKSPSFPLLPLGSPVALSPRDARSVLAAAALHPGCCPREHLRTPPPPQRARV